MHRFLHGIWLFLTACGGPLFTCLPLLPLDGVEQEDSEKQKPHDGQTSGDLLQPEYEGQDKGDLPPLSGAACQQEGRSLAVADKQELLPCLQDGQQEEATAEINLQQQSRSPKKGEMMAPSRQQEETRMMQLIQHCT